MINNGEITVGQITSFLLYMIFLIFQFLMIGCVIGSFYRLYGACEKVIEMIRAEVNVGDGGGIKPD